MSRFRMTGSRSFGSAKPCSDLDMFGQDSPELRAELFAKGYRRVRITNKMGPNIAVMMRRGRGGQGNVDIGLYKDVGRKAWENRIAKITPIALVMKHAPKPIRERVWGWIQSL